MQPILAQYTIRSKQDYVFKTSKIVEIVGASSHIRDAWEYLFECAKGIGKRVVRVSDHNYNHADILTKFESGEIHISELFCGGGNETVLMDSMETYLAVNREFSYYVLKNCPGMIPMVVCVPATDNYKQDYDALMVEAEIEKNRMSSGQDNFILPFSMMDRDTFRPLTRIDTMEGELLRYSEESYTKRVKGIEERNNDRAIKILDKMVSKKGEESLLAVVHADGNNMGAKIMEMLSGKTSYDECVSVMREFTGTTDMAFVKCGIEAIENKQKELEDKVSKKDTLAFRIIIKDGDDMTFICNARYVMEYVKAYITAVQNYKSKWKYSSCAGICIFHSHYPFSRAYELAEQACDDGAKNMVHKVDADGRPLAIEEGWVDFHYIHSGVGGNLEEIRSEHNTSGCMARPWLISGEGTSVFTIESLYKLNSILTQGKIARAVIKDIGAAAEEGDETGLRELQRVFNRYPAVKKDIGVLFPGEREQLKAFYDLAEVYDLWFKEDGK